MILLLDIAFAGLSAHAYDALFCIDVYVNESSLSVPNVIALTFFGGVLAVVARRVRGGTISDYYFFLVFFLSFFLSIFVSFRIFVRFAGSFPAQQNVNR